MTDFQTMMIGDMAKSRLPDSPPDKGFAAYMMIAELSNGIKALRAMDAQDVACGKGGDGVRVSSHLLKLAAELNVLAYRVILQERGGI